MIHTATFLIQLSLELVVSNLKEKLPFGHVLNSKNGIQDRGGNDDLRLLARIPSSFLLPCDESSPCFFIFNRITIVLWLSAVVVLIYSHNKYCRNWYVEF
jgi:hypothetical protein